LKCIQFEQNVFEVFEALGYIEQVFVGEERRKKSGRGGGRRGVYV
jgi:hypothetical protein